MGNSLAIKKLNDVHVQMMDYIMANPGCTYEQISAACGGYSIGWISQIVNSDAFQAQLKERQVEIFGDLKLTIKDRVTGLAHASLKRLEERIPTETDIDKVANVADLALKSLGFGPKAPSMGGPAVGQQNNFFVGQVDRQSLEAARQLMHKTSAEKEINPLPEPAGATAQ